MAAVLSLVRMAYLYVSFGDGGGQGDKHGKFGNGQKMDTWFGKILRIDINTKSGYTVPKDNLFVGKTGVKPEICFMVPLFARVPGRKHQGLLQKK